MSATALLAVFGRPVLWQAVRGYLGLLIGAGTCLTVVAAVGMGMHAAT